MCPNSLYLFCCQTLQLLQGLQLYHFSSRDSISLLHGKNHHCLGVKHLMPTLSTSLALITCVGVSTHSRDSEIVLTITHAQDGQCHQTQVGQTYTFTVQAANCGSDLRGPESGHVTVSLQGTYVQRNACLRNRGSCL